MSTNRTAVDLVAGETVAGEETDDLILHLSLLGLEPGELALRELFVGEVVEGRAAPQSEGLAEQVAGARQLVVLERTQPLARDATWRAGDPLRARSPPFDP